MAAHHRSFTLGSNITSDTEWETDWWFFIIFFSLCWGHLFTCQCILSSVIDYCVFCEIYSFLSIIMPIYFFLQSITMICAVCQVCNIFRIQCDIFYIFWINAVEFIWFCNFFFFFKCSFYFFLSLLWLRLYIILLFCFSNFIQYMIILFRFTNFILYTLDISVL